MSEWIAVSDRLPDNENDQLCLRCGGRPPIVAALYAGEWFSFDRPDEPVRHITHWTQLPEWKP
jgi:hypothetical protein